MTDGRRRAEIAGAGIAGLAAAAALAGRGWQVRVHERDAELRELGAGHLPARERHQGPGGARRVRGGHAGG